ncbi:hypothetical protein PQR57_29340 [Paraburkholderia dipogonis]|uniref:Uncharacterized protein n=1 Tax=Paraburkholderia dipogonis TaxID=1211383 RepID=A0ABW9AYZ0_9BURK
MKRFHSSDALSIPILVAALISGPGDAIGGDVTSNSGKVSAVFTRTTDTFTLSNPNLAIPFDVKKTSTLIIHVSLRGVANSEREYGVNCSGSTVTCEPFAGLELFHTGMRNNLSFTTVARNVPQGTGVVNLHVFSECAVACSGTEQLTVETLTAVVKASDQ